MACVLSRTHTASYCLSTSDRLANNTIKWSKTNLVVCDVPPFRGVCAPALCALRSHTLWQTAQQSLREGRCESCLASMHPMTRGAGGQC